MAMENHGESTAKKAHILVISLPYQGHMSPMMQFAKRLSSKGVRVTIITPFSAIVISDNYSINIEYISYDHQQGQTISSVEDYMANIQNRASEKLVQVIEKQKSHPFDVLVHDSLLPWAVDFGHQHGLRVAIFFTQPCAISSIYYLVYQGKIKCPVEEGADLSFLPEEIPISHVKDLPYDLFHEKYAGTLDMLANQFSNVDNADWIFFNTFLGLEDQVSTFFQGLFWAWKIRLVLSYIFAKSKDFSLLLDTVYLLTKAFCVYGTFHSPYH